MFDEPLLVYAATFAVAFFAFFGRTAPASASRRPRQAKFVAVVASPSEVSFERIGEKYAKCEIFPDEQMGWYDPMWSKRLTADQ